MTQCYLYFNLEETYPEIELEFNSYMGGNATGYSWAQMRADDIPDIFITSQILDGELAKERLADLSGYPFVNDLSTSILDQVSIDGGIYLLPAGNSMYGIYYNKTLMEEHHWEVPSDFAELESLCGEIREAGLIPGVVGTQLTGGPFSTVFNLAKTDWLTTPEGVKWEQDFLAGNAAAEGRWEETMEYVGRYMDIGMFHTDPEDRNNPQILLDWLGNRRAVFCTMVQTVNITELPDTGDKLGMMPFISRDGSKNVYMYSPAFYFGISSRLTEPGNEEKLENAIKIMSLLCSPEGQAAFSSESAPCVISALNSANPPEDSLIKHGSIAKALMRYCNLGNKIIISTHSDTLAGRINNLILVSRMKNVIRKNDIIEKLNWSMQDILQPEKTVNIYEFKKMKMAVWSSRSWNFLIIQR